MSMHVLFSGLKVPLNQADIWVIGLGKTGLSLAQYWKKQGYRVWVCDTRESPPELHSWLQLGGTRSYTDCSCIPDGSIVMVSSSISPQHPWIIEINRKKCIIFSEMDVFSVINKRPVLAVPGTNGKTTTCTMLIDMLRQSDVNASMIGNSGTPMLNNVSLPDVWVMELSSYQCYWLKSRIADVAAVLNIEPDHLDWHAGYDEYRRCKQSLIQWSKDSVSLSSAKLQVEGRQGRYEYVKEGVVTLSGKILTQWNDTMHRHDKMNALVAVAMIHEAGLSLLPYLQSNTWKPRHRCEEWVADNGVRWINDSKGTNVAATRAALTHYLSLGQPVYWLIGGVFKETSFPWGLTKKPVWVGCFGRDSNKLMEELPNDLNKHKFDGLMLALADLPSLPRHAIVLLSPACASFDEFQNYQQRGDMFLTWARSTNDTNNQY